MRQDSGEPEGSGPVAEAADEPENTAVESTPDQPSPLPFATDIAERVMIFLDWGYIIAGTRDHQEDGPVDIKKLALKLAGKRRLIRTYVYDGKIESPPNQNWRERQQNQQRFASSIAYAPYVEIRWGRLQLSDNGPPRQKGVDVLLSLDMLRFALKDNYDTAILVSGDGDYADIVRMVKDEGRTVEVMTIPGSRAFSLVEAADLWQEMNVEYLKDCRMEDQSGK